MRGAAADCRVRRQEEVEHQQLMERLRREKQKVEAEYQRLKVGAPRSGPARSGPPV